MFHPRVPMWSTAVEPGLPRGTDPAFPRSRPSIPEGTPTLNKSVRLLPLLVGAAFAQVPPARSLDAGTWVRQSLSVVPAQVGECPPEEIFLRRAFRRLNAELLPMRDVARAQAQEEKAYCEEAREVLVRRLDGDWSGLAGMQRFDRNDLPPERMEAVRVAVASTPWPAMPTVLASQVADTLRGLLAAKSLERSQHLVSDEQRNSSISVKMKTEDVTDTELSLLRGSAHVLALRVGGLDVGRSRKGLSFRADFAAAIWSFDPGSKSFASEGAWAASANEGGSAGYAGSQVAGTGMQFGSRVLDLPAFHFTTQILAGNVGDWINPASTFSTNTGADLGFNRRFRYFENRVDASGNTVPVPAGYGYLDDHFPKDSTWRLRHIGGIQPYSGLVLEEVPGDAWGFVSLTEVGSRIDGRNDSGGDLSVNLRAASPLWELRFGSRVPLGSSHSFFSADIPFYFGDVHGSLGYSPRSNDAQETGLLFGWGIEPGWETRWNIRRAFFTAGAQVGLRMNTVFLSSPDQGSLLYDQNINWLRNFEGVVTLHGGVSWSLTPWSGVGVEVAYDWLDGRSDWECGSGNSYYDADWTSVPGPTAGQGRLRWLFQYVWK